MHRGGGRAVVLAEASHELHDEGRRQRLVALGELGDREEHVRGALLGRPREDAIGPSVRRARASSPLAISSIA